MTGGGGINSNFFSAIRRASADLVATCDQDDLWHPDKIEKQVEAIGDNLLCIGRSRAFREDGSFDHYDSRMPNYHLIRMIYISIAGHDLLFRKKLLDYIPVYPSSYGYLYDHVLGFTAAALDSISVVNEILVEFRRHEGAATYSLFDKRRTKSTGNALYILRWSLINYSKVRPHVAKYFQRKLRLLQDIKASSPTKDDAMKIMEYEAGIRKPMLLGLAKYHYKYHRVLFYTEGKGLIYKIRALLFGLMHLYNYKHLL